MEKRKPHYVLEEAKRLIEKGFFFVTASALKSAANDFGLVGKVQVGACVKELSTRDFYKSMTTHYDSSLWQDVYHKRFAGIDAYIKIQIVESGTVIISFKQREQG